MLNEELKEKSGSGLFELLMALIYIVGKAQCFESKHFYIEFKTRRKMKRLLLLLLLFFFFIRTDTPL